MRDDGDCGSQHDRHATIGQLIVYPGIYWSYAMTVVEMIDTRMPIVFFVALDLQVDASTITECSRVQSLTYQFNGSFGLSEGCGSKTISPTFFRPRVSSWRC